MLQNVKKLEDCMTVKDYIILVAEGFLTMKKCITKPQFCEELGTYKTRLSAYHGKRAWDTLERWGVLTHPKQPSTGKPMKRFYCLAKPEEEIDRLIGNLDDEGFKFGTKPTADEIVTQIKPPDVKVEEKKSELDKAIEDHVEKHNQKNKIIRKRIDMLVTELDIVAEEIRHITMEIDFLYGLTDEQC